MTSELLNLAIVLRGTLEQLQADPGALLDYDPLQVRASELVEQVSELRQAQRSVGAVVNTVDDVIALLAPLSASGKGDMAIRYTDSYGKFAARLIAHADWIEVTRA